MAQATQTRRGPTEEPLGERELVSAWLVQDDDEEEDLGEDDEGEDEEEEEEDDDDGRYRPGWSD